MTATLVGCVQTDRIVPGQKYRITIEESTLSWWTFGNEIPNVYQSLSVSPWVFVTSEPPIDNQRVLVADVRVRQSSVGSSPLGSVAELLNSLNDLIFFSSSYDVTRLERIDTTKAEAPAQRSRAIQQAVQHQETLGITGTVSEVTKSIGSTVGKVFGGAKTIVIALAVVAGAVAVIYLAKEARAARAA